MSRPGFQVPKVTVTSARTAVPFTTPVSASTPLGRATATTVPIDWPARAASRVVGAAEAAAGGAQVGGAAVVNPRPGRHRADGGTAAGEAGGGVEGVAAVV